MTIRDLIRYLMPRRMTLLLASVLMIGGSIATLATPWFAGRFAEVILISDVTEQVAPNISVGLMLGVWLLVLIIQALLSFFATYLVTFSGAEILANLSNRLYEHLQMLPLDFHNYRKRGDLLALLSNDIAILSHFVSGTLTSLAPMLFTLVGALVMMALIDKGVAMLVVVLVPFFFLILKVLGRQIRPVSEALVQKQADSLALAEENLGLISLIKAFNREATEFRRYRQRTLNVLALRKEQLRLQALLSPATQLLSSAGILLILWVSSQHLRAAQITIPELISLLLYGLLFARPVSSLANLYGQMQQVIGSSKRLLNVLSVESEPHETSFSELPKVNGEIKFCDVSFGYSGRPPLWDKLNLHIKVGETVAITGLNGMGKTTLLHLLMRFNDPQQGRILIDGHDISTVSLASLRQQLGFVSQHTLLSDGTVEDNIRYGHPDASQEEIEAVAREACVHDFVVNLPEGYQTQIGELGVRLSGGQRQRIALARVLLSKPGILLLDEATSMFDQQGELQFFEQSHKLFAKHTVILIAHCEAGWMQADRVLKLENGALTDITVDHKTREVS
ncbi:MAG: ABC transporter ATP-binding protein [Flavobacteriales bacterium]|nr:ABC transporter ATP-binding protein [Flavobacteriales bacterium]